MNTEDGRLMTITGADRTPLEGRMGGAPVSPPQRRGFGAVVMKEMAGRSVNGTVYLEYAPSDR